MIGADELAADLAGTGVDVFTYVPEVLPEACLVLEPDQDYLIDGDTFDRSTFTGRGVLWALVDLLGNEQAATDLDALLTQVLPVIRSSEWSLVAMTKPGPLNNGVWLAYGAALTITNPNVPIV